MKHRLRLSGNTAAAAARRLTGLLIFFLPAMGVQAQHNTGLPDSVIVNEDQSTSVDLGRQTDTVTTSDTANKKTEEEERLVSRIVPDSAVYAAKRSKDFEYANDPAYWAKDEDSGKKEADDKTNSEKLLLGAKWLRIMVFILVGAALLFAFYKIVIENRLYLFYKGPGAVAGEAGKEEELKKEDLDEKIKVSISSGDFRSTIRFMYLKALSIAGEQGLIQLRQQATDYDYLLEWKDPASRDGFGFLTRVFEHAWYGGVEVTKLQFENLRNLFENFYKQIGH